MPGPLVVAGVIALVALIAIQLDGCGIKEEKMEVVDVEVYPIEDVKESVAAQEEIEKEIPEEGACVMCTATVEGPMVYVLDEDKNPVLINGVSNLNRTNIKLSGYFPKCIECESGVCDVEEEDIEDKEWKDYDASLDMGENDEKEILQTLDIKKSYMMCLKGPGLIYFIDSGQVIKGAWDTLNKFVCEDTFKKMNSRWDIALFKSVYGTDGTDVFEKMRSLMFEAGITDQISICAFLAAIGVESEYGAKKIEDIKNVNSKVYTERVRGVGLIQVTGMNQKEFMLWMKDRENDPEKQKKLEMYASLYSKGPPMDNTENVAEFLAENYAVEISIWYWGYSKWPYYPNIEYDESNVKNISPNDYVTYFGVENSNIDNVFLASQMHINTKGNWLPSRKQKIAMEESDKYKIALETGYENKQVSAEEDNRPYCISFMEDGKPHSDYISSGWGMRFHDWEQLKTMIVQ